MWYTINVMQDKYIDMIDQYLQVIDGRSYYECLRDAEQTP